MLHNIYRPIVPETTVVPPKDVTDQEALSFATESVSALYKLPHIIQRPALMQYNIDWFTNELRTNVKKFMAQELLATFENYVEYQQKALWQSYAI